MSSKFFKQALAKVSQETKDKVSAYLDNLEKMDNKTSFAKMLNGRQKNEEMSMIDNEVAENLGLVVVFGWSDDLIEFRGNVAGEYGTWKSASVWISNKLEITQDIDKAISWRYEKHQIDAIWCPVKDGESEPYASWFIDCESLNTASFDIMDGDKLYCRGIVFDYEDLLFSQI